MADNRDEEVRLHQKKWEKWKAEMRKNEPCVKKDTNVSESAHSYAVSLINKLQQPDKKESQGSKVVEEEFESNICCICLELMIPPYKPMILFPCAHNVCKVCLYVNGDQKQSRYEMKISICPMCKKPIGNSAQNRNLMKLICTYSDNKHLLEKQVEEVEEQSYSGNIEKLKLRCQILERERRSLTSELTKQQKDKKILNEVIEKLLEEKRKNKKQVEALEEEAKLINRFMSEKKEEMEKMDAKIATVEAKKKIVEKTLEPLKREQEKQEVLEAAKLLAQM